MTGDNSDDREKADELEGGNLPDIATDYDTQSAEQRERVLEEILDPVDVYTEGEGPEGPWRWRSLTVKRIDNRIHVYDVDGVNADVLTVPDFTREDTADDPHAALREKLDELHEGTLAAL